MMQPGNLDQRIDLRHLSQVQRADGGFDRFWTRYDTVWAAVAPVRGRDRDMADQTEHPRDYKITIRYRADLVNTDSVLWRGSEMRIVYIEDAGPRPLYLTFHCQRGVAV